MQWKRILSGLLAVATVAGGLPVSALAWDAPQNQWQPAGRDGVAARFFVGSDTHIGRNAAAEEKLKNALDVFYSVDPDTEGVLLVGDVTDNGTTTEYDTLMGIVGGSSIADKVQLSMGNHEYNSGTMSRFEEKTNQPANTVLRYRDAQEHLTATVVKLSAKNYAGDYRDQYEALKTALEQSAAENAAAPVIVMGHHGIRDTAYVTQEWYGNYGAGTDRDMLALMAQYPQVIHISGHSHATLEDARSIHQDLGFTAIQDGTIGAYFENESGKVNPDSGAASTYPAEREYASQALRIDVLEDGTVELYRMNLTDGTYMYEDEPWQFSPAALPYTQARAAQSQAPSFGEQTSVTVSGITGSSMQIQFPSAVEASGKNVDMVHAYQITLTNVKDNSKIVRSVFADYYLQPRKDLWQVKIADLPAQTTFEVAVQAATSFGAQSSPITATETVTTGEGDKPVYPAQAILDVDFSRDEDGADAKGHTKKVYGTPEMRMDETLGRMVASFDGKDDGLRYSMTSADYEKLTRNFTVELYYKPKDTVNNNPLGNTESSGFCFEQKSGTNTLQFWAHIGGSYKKPEAKVQKNGWNHVIGTYDGANVKIYLNGELKNTVAATGAMKEPPHYLFLGGDSTAAGELQYAANCEIALARVYTGTMTAKDVQTAYADASAPGGEQDTELKADMLDVSFADGTGMDNSETANLFKTAGSPTIGQDDAFGKQVASFNGVSDALLYAFDDLKYARMSQGVTIESVFYFDEIPTSGEHDIFSNQQSGGIGLGLENGRLQFYCNINKTTGGNGYVQPNAAIEAGKWYHAVGVFDGAEVKLYLNGKLVSKKAAGGSTIHWTTNPNAKNMVIGGDSSSAGGAEFFSKGSVSLARLYSKGASDEQVAQLYAQLQPTMIEVDGQISTMPLHQPYAVPKAVSSNQETVTVTVTGPDGREITLEEGRFTPVVAGQYTITYATPSGTPRRVFVCKAIDAENLPVTLGMVTTEQSASGGLFHVSIHLNRDKDLTVKKSAFDLSFDPSLVTYAGNENLKSGLTLTEGENGLLHMTYDGAVSDAGFENYSQTRLVKLTFQAKELEQDQNASFSFSNVKIEASTNQIITQQGTVKLIGKSSLDLNGDGVIGAGDVALAASAEQREMIAAQAAIYPYKHAVVITMDGGGVCFRPDQMYYASDGATSLTGDASVLAKRQNPYAMKLFEEYFAASFDARSETPTISAQNYTSILHGKEYATAQPEYQIDNTKTGEYYYPDFGKETPVYPSVFMALGNSFPTKSNAAFAEWVQILNGIIEPNAPVYSHRSTYQNGSLQNVADYIRSDAYQKTALVYMQSDYMDEIGHSKGYYTDTYYEQLAVYDDYLQSVMQALEETGTLDETLLLIGSDHGGTAGGSHGGTTNQEYDVQLALGGQTIASGKRLTGGTNHDIPAIVLSALRGQIPESMDGSDNLLRQATLSQQQLVAQNRTVETVTAVTGTNVNAVELRLSDVQPENTIAAVDVVLNMAGRTAETIETTGTILRSQMRDGKLYLTIAYSETPQTLARVNLSGAAEGVTVEEFMLGTSKGREIYGDLVSTRGELAVQTKPDGGNSGGSSSGGSTGQTGSVTNADGTLTQTTTVRATDATTGANIETKTVTVTAKDGSVQKTETISVSGGTDGISGTVVSQTAADKTVSVTAKLSAAQGGKQLRIPSAVAAAIQKGSSAQVALSVGGFALDLDAAAMQGIFSVGGQTPLITVEPAPSDALPESVQGSPAYSFSVDGKGVSFGEGKVSAALSYEQKDVSKRVEVFYVGQNQSLTRINGASYQQGQLTFAMTHWSTYAIVESELVSFADVAESAWYYDAVQYVLQNGLFAGTSENAFSPEAEMSRAMVWMVLARLDGEQTDGGGSWYEKAQQWAVQNGISDGTNPNGSVTREQLTVLLYRYAGEPETGALSIDFSDAEDIAPYAKTAMTWAVQQGLIIGTAEARLSPTATATRAQVAAILQRFHAQST